MRDVARQRVRAKGRAVLCFEREEVARRGGAVPQVRSGGEERYVRREEAAGAAARGVGDGRRGRGGRSGAGDVRRRGAVCASRGCSEVIGSADLNARLVIC